MSDLKPDKIRAYLEALLGKPVTILGLGLLGQSPREETIKGYGYGTPIQVEYQVGGERQRAVAPIWWSVRPEIRKESIAKLARGL